MLLWLSGCFSNCKWGTCSQPGETVAEGQRRHCRNLYINQQNLNADIDRALLSDKPSQAAPMRLPPPVEPQGK